MTYTANPFTSAVLDNWRRLQQTTRSGVGYMLPRRELIGKALQDWVDEQTQKQVSRGVIRINPLGEAGGVFDIYI